MSMHGRNEKYIQKFWLKLHEKGLVEDLTIHWTIILKWIY
jgi:hypothetical protein